MNHHKLQNFAAKKTSSSLAYLNDILNSSAQDKGGADYASKLKNCDKAMENQSCGPSLLQ